MCHASLAKQSRISKEIAAPFALRNDSLIAAALRDCNDIRCAKLTSGFACRKTLLMLMTKKKGLLFVVGNSATFSSRCGEGRRYSGKT